LRSTSPSGTNTAAPWTSGTVGIAEHARKLPAGLSGGQQQRLSIARAMANDPPLLVADEPTGSLDSVTAEAVMDVFEKSADAGSHDLHGHPRPGHRPAAGHAPSLCPMAHLSAGSAEVAHA